VRVADLLEDPAVERADVGVERVDLVGELELDVVRGGGEHQRGLDALCVHQRQAQIAVAVRLGLRAELGDQRRALRLVEPAQRVQAVEQHAGDRGHGGGRAPRLMRGTARVADPGGVAEHPRQLLGRVGHLARVELRRPAREQLQVAARRVGHVADRELALAGIDVALVQVERLVEVVVRVVDPVGQGIGHAAPPLDGRPRLPPRPPESHAFHAGCLARARSARSVRAHSRQNSALSSGMSVANTSA
jgi:hypothetical protein